MNRLFITGVVAVFALAVADLSAQASSTFSAPTRAEHGAVVLSPLAYDAKAGGGEPRNPNE
jgi:hypothetical protein